MDKIQFIMNVVANLEVKNGKVIPVSNGVDHTIKRKTFRLRVFSQNRIMSADVFAETRGSAIEKLAKANYTFAR